MRSISVFRRLSALAVLALFVAASPAWSGDVKVIANPSVTASSISADELKGIFLITRTSLADGSHVEPVLVKGGPVHQAFLNGFIGKTDTALETYYRSLVFTGKASMPKQVASEAEVAAYVAKTKGAIGYVTGGSIPAGVKVLDVK
jgi:hypothetical protein